MAAPAPGVREMAMSDLEGVVAIEQRAYSFPWTRGNFTDSLAVGHLTQVLLPTPEPAARRADRGGVDLLGYYIAMAGVEEMHLLNITVHPDHHGQGHARQMLSHLMAASLARGARMLWLEVRQSNARARHLYTRWGFEQVGVRKGYYPNGQSLREDAIVMRLPLVAEGGHVLD